MHQALCTGKGSTQSQTVFGGFGTQSGFLLTLIKVYVYRVISVVTNVINIPGPYNHVRVPGVNLSNKSAILISAMIPNDLIIGLTQAQDSYTANTMYEIVISGWGNTKSVIR